MFICLALYAPRVVNSRAGCSAVAFIGVGALLNVFRPRWRYRQLLTADYSCAYKRKACTAAPQLTRRSRVCCFTLSGRRATADLRAVRFSGARLHIVIKAQRSLSGSRLLSGNLLSYATAFIATATAFVISTRVPSALDYPRVQRLSGLRALTITAPGLADLYFRYNPVHNFFFLSC